MKIRQPKTLLYFLLIVGLVMITSGDDCGDPEPAYPTGPPANTPAPTPAGGFFLNYQLQQTNFINGVPTGSVVTSHPPTRIVGQWVQDFTGSNLGAFGSVFFFDVVASRAVPNGRVNAIWRVFAHSGPCVGRSGLLSVPNMVGTPSFQFLLMSNVWVVCNSTNNIIFTPIIISPICTVPPFCGSADFNVVRIADDMDHQFDTTYGMPVAMLYDSNGTLLSQVQASSLSADGTTLQFNGSSLPSNFAGTVYMTIWNPNAAGDWDYVTNGFTTTVGGGDPPPPPDDPCGGQPCLIE